MADGASSLDSDQGLLRYVFQTIVEGFLSISWVTKLLTSDGCLIILILGMEPAVLHFSIDAGARKSSVENCA